MAFKGKEIFNSRTGQRIKFLQTAGDTNGQLLEIQSTFSPHSKEPVPHYHPYQEEDFTVLSGQISVRMDGQPKIYKAGDHLHIPPNRVHSMWNHTDEMSVVNWKVRPALSTEYLLETGIGLANAGKVGDEGMPGVLQVAVMMNHFDNVYRITRPPRVIQKIVFYSLMPLAWLLGYRAMYAEYID
jgi:quercetin dioxygenase-like cupin family protein